jgi:hypothetical protein
MTADEIVEIEIADDGRLLVRPRLSDLGSLHLFEFIYRAGMGVGWEAANRTFVAPKPRELSYAQWFRQIVDAAAGECGVQLQITSRTTWTNVPEILRAEIEAGLN